MAILKMHAEAYQDTTNIGEAIENSLIIHAVVLGQIEGRPMTASDIAAYIGMPRTTVIHKLSKMPASVGITKHRRGTRVELEISTANSELVLSKIAQACKAIADVYIELSKIDTELIDSIRRIN